jgi:serpin B
MSHRSVLQLIIAVSLVATAGAHALAWGLFGYVTADKSPPADSQAARAYANAVNGLGLDLWRELRSKGNAAISPASIETALTMVYAGARGTTASAMARVLHLTTDQKQAATAAGELVRVWNDPSQTMYTLSVANRIFAERELQIDPSYLAMTRDEFAAELERLDFKHSASAALSVINGWVALRTHDRIRDILSEGSVTSATRLVLVNAIYFHGEWQQAFERKATRPEPFYAEGTQRNVAMMHKAGGRYGEHAGVKLLELVYRGGDLGMMFALPPTRSGLQELEARLDPALVVSWARSLQPDNEVVVALPKFRIETGSIELTGLLNALGMRSAFSDLADFSGMSERREDQFHVDRVVHKAFVELDEVGTEAAAATGVVMDFTTSIETRRAPPVFRADHPFLFLLRDLRTGAILFLGRVVEPS